MTAQGAPGQTALEALVRRIAAAPPTYCLSALANSYRSIAATWRPLDAGELVAMAERHGHPLPTVRELTPLDFARVEVELLRAQAGIGRLAPPAAATKASEFAELVSWGTMARHALRRHLEDRGGRHLDLEEILLGHGWSRYRGLVPPGAELLALRPGTALWAFDVAGALARQKSRVLEFLAIISMAAGRQLAAHGRGSPSQRWEVESLGAAALEPARFFARGIDPLLWEALEREASDLGVAVGAVLSRECLIAGFLALTGLLGPTGELPRDFAGFDRLADDWRRRLRREVKHQLAPRRPLAGAATLEEGTADPAAGKGFCEFEMREELHDWLRSLSPRERDVCQLALEEDLSTTEIARRLRISEIAVRQHWFRGLGKLRVQAPT